MATTKLTDKTIADLYAKKRKSNLILLVTLLAFVFSLVALSFIVRINHLKGLAD